MYTNLSLKEHTSLMKVIDFHLKDTVYKKELEEEGKKIKIGLDYIYYSYITLDKEMTYLINTYNKNNDIDIEDLKKRLIYLKKILKKLKSMYKNNLKKLNILLENDRRQNMVVDMIVYNMYRYPIYRDRVARLYSVDKKTRNEYTDKLKQLSIKMDIMDAGIEFFNDEINGMKRALIDFYYLKDIIVIE